MSVPVRVSDSLLPGYTEPGGVQLDLHVGTVPGACAYHDWQERAWRWSEVPICICPVVHAEMFEYFRSLLTRC